MWPDNVLRQFQIVSVDNPKISDFVPPYHKLLYTLFPADTPFTVVPKHRKAGSPPARKWIMTLEVIYIDKPVFMLELRKPADLESTSARQLAETQIMQYMADLRCESQVLSHFYG
jgi:hypothetical protein